MKKSLLLFLLVNVLLPSYAQDKKWATNVGIEAGTDAMFGLAGLSTLKKGDNPLVNSDLNRTWAVATDLYLELLKLHQRPDVTYGSVTPTFGFKTKLEWSVFNADNSKNAGGENLVLNTIGVPLLFEICLGHKEGVTRASYSPGTTTYTGRSNYDHSVTVTEQSTPGTYSSGGAKTCWGSFIYFGPKMCYIFKSFNTGNVIDDNNLVKNYTALVGGITFYTHKLNLDFSYQKGMTSIYKGKDITIDGFLVTLGINFTSRLYNHR